MAPEVETVEISTEVYEQAITLATEIANDPAVPVRTRAKCELLRRALLGITK